MQNICNSNDTFTREKNFITISIKLTITGLAIWFVLKNIDFNLTLKTLKSANLCYLFLGLLMFNISKIVSSIRLHWFYSCVGLFLSQKQNVKLYYVGMFYNLILPGSIGGDGYKVYLLKTQSEIKAKKLISATLMDRISGVTILLSFSFLMLNGILTRFNIPSKSLVICCSILIAMAVISIYYLFLVFLLPDFLNGFIYTTWLSIWVQIGQVFCAFFLLISLGVTSFYWDYLVLFMLSSIVSVLPFTIGGLGARELVFLYGYRYLLVDKNVSIAFTTLFFTVIVLSALIGFIYSFNFNKEKILKST